MVLVLHTSSKRHLKKLISVVELTPKNYREKHNFRYSTYSKMTIMIQTMLLVASVIFAHGNIHLRNTIRVACKLYDMQYEIQRANHKNIQ